MAKGKTVVITGASKGLGKAMVLEFARLGHTVVGCARSSQSISELQRRLGDSHFFSVVDVADHGQVNAWAEQAMAEYGVPDLLLNNAAVINRLAPLWQLSDEEFSKVVEINIKGVANVIRGFVPAMVKRKSGVIVNFSSGWGRTTNPEVAPYCATKYAIEGLTQAMAQELPAGMAAIPLNPGIIDTDMLRSCFGSSAGNYVSPERWAAKAVPFILKLGPGDNGQSLTV